MLGLVSVSGRIPFYRVGAGVMPHDYRANSNQLEACVSRKYSAQENYHGTRRAMDKPSALSDITICNFYLQIFLT
jgi:hypothetical protein